MKRRLHIVRDGQPAILDEADWVVYLHDMRLADHGAPPQPPGTISYDQLLALILAAELVVTW